jgi:predicted nucleotidyltransferase
MNKYQKILDSFSLKETLNPKIWDDPKSPKDSKMKSKVRTALIKIADEFIEYLGEDTFVDDIVLTGSLSNFNWSEFSDFDLHIIVDLDEYKGQEKIYKEIFNLKKQVFNDKHDIKIFGYDVELYAQDSKEPHHSTGVYSIMNDEWINVPSKDTKDINKEVLEKKIKTWVDKIENAMDDAISDSNIDTLNKVREKIKEYRKSGLEKEGELSYENLVFKFLRRSGHIEKIFELINKMTDKNLSIENKEKL